MRKELKWNTLPKSVRPFCGKFGLSSTGELSALKKKYLSMKGVV